MRRNMIRIWVRSVSKTISRTEGEDTTHGDETEDGIQSVEQPESANLILRRGLPRHALLETYRKVYKHEDEELLEPNLVRVNMVSL